MPAVVECAADSTISPGEIRPGAATSAGNLPNAEDDGVRIGTGWRP